MEKAIKQVIKLDGRKEDFDSKKIFMSIWMAARNVGGRDETLARVLRNQVLRILKGKYTNGEAIKTSESGNYRLFS